MSIVPIPAYVHYELLLQLLERQSILAVDKKQHREQIQQLIITLRKAAALQRQLEENLERDGLTVEYHWALNQPNPSTAVNLQDPNRSNDPWRHGETDA